MQTSTLRVFFVSMTLGIFALSALAAEEKVEPSKLPKTVADALKTRFPEAELTSAAKETENSQVVYDIELRQKGRKYESDIKADGTILEIEKEMVQQSWPKALPAAIQAKYPKASISEVMEVSKVAGKKETPDHYEVTLITADKKSKEVLASLDGKTITEEAAE
jgi:hypothetical protein